MKQADKTILLTQIDNAIAALDNIPKRIIENEIPARNGMQLIDIHKLLTREKKIIDLLPVSVEHQTDENEDY